MADRQPLPCSDKMYTPLDIPSKQIRLLHLLPGTRDEDIRCSISTATIDTPFEALSYTWGDSQDEKRSIEVQGRPTAVTRNLEAALRDLRATDEARTLWVDAVCINQDDLTERKHQVMMMDKIYGGAEQVVAWLGCGEGDEETLEFMSQRMGAPPDRHWGPSSDLEDDKDIVAQFVRLCNFLASIEWCRRIWTAQEAALARTLTYMCGSFIFTHRAVVDFMRSFQAHCLSGKCCDLEARTMKHRIFGISKSINKCLAGLSVSSEGPEKMSFLTAATVFRSRGATDPRDKVFGILGITHDLPEDIIDYDTSVAEVYAKATVHLIQTTQTLDALSYVLPCSPYSLQAREPMLRPAALPSWAPDWSDNRRSEQRRSDELITRQDFASVFRACGENSTAHLRCTSDKLKKLVLDGFHCGSISQAGPACSPEKLLGLWTTAYPVISAWREMLNVDRNPQQAYESAAPGQPQSTILDAFWRTLCANIDTSRDSAGEIQETGSGTQLCHDQLWIHWLQQNRFPDCPTVDLEIPELDLVKIRKLIICNIFGRRLVSSDTGLIGLAPEHAQEGDQIWVLDGGRVPFIIRPRSGEEVESGEYTFIGDSYIHEIMEGQLSEQGRPKQTVTLV